MKVTALFLAALFAVLTAFGQGPTNGRTGDEAAKARRDQGAGSVEKSGQSRDDVMRIPSPGAPAGPEEEEMTAVTVWKLVQKGGWAMIALAFLSIMTVMLVLVYLFTLRRSAILTGHYMNTADVLLKKRDYLGLLAISSRHSEAVARVVQRTLDFATKNPNASYDTVREIAETEGSAQAASLQHRTIYLADIGVLSPMVGLLGTVTGIIRAFAKLGSGEANISRDILLASGVSEALIATAAGLIIGVLAMGFYSLFRNRVQSLISDLEIASAHIVGLIALNYNKKREHSRVAIDDEF